MKSNTQNSSDDQIGDDLKLSVAFHERKIYLTIKNESNQKLKVNYPSSINTYFHVAKSGIKVEPYEFIRMYVDGPSLVVVPSKESKTISCDISLNKVFPLVPNTTYDIMAEYFPGKLSTKNPLKVYSQAIAFTYRQ